jgi:hypothetical protein
VTKAQYEALKWAVGKAEEWRGSLTGCPDPARLAEFDANLALAKAGVKEAARMRGAEKQRYIRKGS